MVITPSFCKVFQKQDKLQCSSSCYIFLDVGIEIFLTYLNRLGWRDILYHWTFKKSLLGVPKNITWWLPVKCCFVIYPLTMQSIQFCKKAKLTLKESCSSLVEDIHASISGCNPKIHLCLLEAPWSSWCIWENRYSELQYLVFLRQDAFLYDMPAICSLKTLELKA